MSDPIEYCECCSMIDLLEWCNSRNTDKEFEHKLTVAIVDLIQKKRRKKPLGKSVHYRKKGIGFDLNFCPECGKVLKEREQK